MKFAVSVFAILALFSCTNKNSIGRYIDENDTSFSKDIRDISAKINKSPKDASLYYRRGNAFFYLDKFKDAVIDFETSVFLDSSNPQYHFRTAEAVLKLDTADSKKARRHLEKAIQLKPDYSEALLLLSQYLIARQEYSPAEKHLQKLTGLPEFADRAFVFLGIIFKEKKDTNIALTYFDKSLQVNPQNYNAAMQVALIHAARNSNLTLDYFNRVIAINELSDEAFYGKGLYLQKRGNYKDALDFYDEALRLNPGHVFAMYNKAVIYSLFEEWQQCEETCNRVLQLSENHSNAYALRAYSYEKRGNKKAALQDYNTALKINPNNEPAKAGIKALGL